MTLPWKCNINIACLQTAALTPFCKPYLFYIFTLTVTWSVESISTDACVKATVENPRGSVEKLSPKESVEGDNTVLTGSVRAPKGFSEGKPETEKPRRHSPRGFAAGGLPGPWGNCEPLKLYYSKV